jgi:hypothetical protein
MTLFTLPTEWLTTLTGSVADVFDAVWPILLFVVAIPLAFYVVKKVIALFPKK